MPIAARERWCKWVISSPTHLPVTDEGSIRHQAAVTNSLLGVALNLAILAHESAVAGAPAAAG